MLMGAFFLALDAKRILNFLILNKSVAARKIRPYFQKKGWRIGSFILKYGFIVFIFYSNISRAYEGQRQWGKKAPKPVLYGIYEVEQFVWNNDTLPPLKTDTIRWDKLVVDKYSTMVYGMDGGREYFKNVTDTLTQKLILSGFNDDSTKNYHDLRYRLKDSLFFIEGRKDQDILRVRFRIKKREDFLLLNRGFHWVNDYPFNR